MIDITTAPSDISISGDIASMLQQVDENLAALNSLRPFDSDAQQEIRRAFLPERVTATLNIEGIAATRRQTLAIMDGMTVDQNSEKEEIEIFNALKADEFVCECHEDGAPIDHGVIREINRILLDGTRDDIGDYRKVPVKITGADFEPPQPNEIQPLVTTIIDEHGKDQETHALVRSAWLHHSIAHVHPFVDGNGRTARLLQDYSLMQGGMYPTGIPSSQRDIYYHALQKADHGNWDELIMLIAENQLSVISRIGAIVRARKERSNWIQNIAKAASSKKNGALYKQYMVWKSRMENIREIFNVSSIELDESSYEVGASCRWFQTMSFDDWKILSTTGKRPSLTWSFSILFFVDGEPFYKIIAYFDRHKANAGDFDEGLSEQVSLLFTGITATSTEKPDFVSFEDGEIRLREIVYFNDMPNVRRQVGDGMTWEEIGSIEVAVQELFEDVFLKKASLG